MKLTKLWKRYADGEVRSVDVKSTEANIKQMLVNGFFLTEDEADKGKVAEAPKSEKSDEKPAAKKPAAKKAPVKLKG